MAATRIKDLPGIHKSAKPSGKLNLRRGEIKKELSPQDVKVLCGNKEKYPIIFCVNSPGFQLSSAEYILRMQPNILKELDLSSNEISDLTCLGEQRKLKRLVVDKNCLTKISFKGLTALQHVSLAFNALEVIPNLRDLVKCVYLDLRGNRIKDGFAHLSEAQSLRLLDLQKNNIDMTIDQLRNTLLQPLKGLPKLQYLSFEANPVEVKINNFRYFIINELPRLEFYNYTRVTKEDRSKAAELASANAFKSETHQERLPNFGTVVLTQRIEEEDDEFDEEEREQLLDDLLGGSPEESSSKRFLYQDSLGPADFSALDDLLDRLEEPGGSTQEDGAMDDDDDLNSLLDDLQGSRDPMDSVAADELEEILVETQEDSLDDILNYLDEPAPSPVQEEDRSTPAPPSLQKMNVASSSSLANLPVMIEDEADYFELLGDMISTPERGESGVNDSSAGNEILDMLDDLIVQSDDRNINPRASVEIGGRDSLDDMLSELMEDSSEPISMSEPVSTPVVPEPVAVPTPTVEPTFEDDDSAADALDELLREEANYSSPPQVEQTPVPPPSVADDDSQLMDLLSEMMEEEAPTPTPTQMPPSKQPQAPQPIEEEADPLDELTASLHEWEQRDISNDFQDDELDAALSGVGDDDSKQNEEEEAQKQQALQEAKQKQQEEEAAFQRRVEEARIAREEEARKQKAELLARQEQERIQRQEEEKRQMEEAERKSQERLKKLEEEEKRIEEELRERAAREEQRRNEEAALRRQQEEKKKQDLEEQQRLAEEERERREREEEAKRELEQKRKDAEEKERQLRAKIEEKRQLLLRQQKEEEERKQRETEEMMRLLEEEQREEERKQLEQEEEERRKLQERSYVDELINHIDSKPDVEYARESLVGVQSDEFNELRSISFPYAIDIDAVQCFELLGGGTFGSCYRGIYQSREVVLKKLNCNLIQDEQFMRQYRADVAEIVQLEHPQLINVKGASTVRELALVTDYIQGTPLFGMLRNRMVVLDVAEKVRFAQQIAMGMVYLHQRGVVFNGLKTKNILINSNNDVILRDYGLQCIKQFVKERGSIGSPQYTAPEVIRNEGPPQQPADVYSFGIVMWELFTGKTPYQGMMARQVSIAVAQEGQRPPEPLDCPIIIWKLMQSCWQENPEARPDFEKLIRILNQPLANIMKYGMTAGSTELPPRGAPVDEQAAYQMKKEDTTRGVAAASDPTANKIHAVLNQVSQMILSRDLEQQQKALKVLVNVGRTEGNIEPILSTKIMLMLHTLLKAEDWRLREGSARALGVLCEWEQCVAVVCEQGTVLVLVENLTHPGEVVVIQAAKTLITLTQQPQGQKAVHAAGGLHPLLKMLDSPNDLIKLQAVWAFSQLLEEESFQQDFYEAGGVRTLLLLLGSANPGIQFRVLVGLGNLISNPKTYPVIEKAGVLKRFLQLLDSKSPILRLQAAKATERMSSKGALRTEITRNGGMDSLIRLLHPQNEADLIMVGLSGLVNFAKDKKQILSFKQAGGLPAVLELLGNKNTSVQFQAIRFFQSFVEGDELNKEIARAIGFLPRCVGLLTSEHPGIQLAAVDTLLEVSSSPKCVEMIQAGGGLPPLIQLIDHTDETVKQKAIQVISSLIAADESVTKTLISTRSVSKLGTLLRSPELKTKEAASLVLAPLCVHAQVRTFMKGINALGSFVSILRATANPKVQEKILFALGLFIKDEQFQDILFSSGAVETILTQLHSSHAMTQTSAIRCMLMLCANQQNKEFLLSVDALTHLQELSSCPSPSVAAAAAKCVSFLQ